MPQDSLRSVVYRSFVTCDDPKGVVECKTIRKSKKVESKLKNSRKTHSNPSYEEDEEEEGEKVRKAPKELTEELQNLSIMEVSRGAEKLNRVAIDSWCNANDLLRGALDLQESLVMLSKLQKASKCKEKVIGGSMELEKPRVSRDCYDELRDVIRESFARRDMVPNLERKSSDVCLDFPSSSSSQSSLIHSYSCECSPLSSVQNEKRKSSPNLIAKLMGLDQEVPSKAEFKQNEKMKVLNQRRSLLDIDLPRPKSKTLEEMIEMMEFKGLFERKDSIDRVSSLRRGLGVEGTPIVLMRPLCAPHQSRWINEEKRVKRFMERKEKLTPPKQKLNVDREDIKHSRKFLIKKSVDVEDRMSTMKINHSKPRLQTKGVVGKIDEKRRVAPNMSKRSETKDAKSSRTQDLGKVTTLKLSRANVSKTQLPQGKIVARDEKTRRISLKPSIPKKNPLKSKPSKPSAAIVENAQNDVESNIQQTLMKSTKPEQITEEVINASSVSIYDINSRDEASSPCRNSDDTKGTTTRHLLSSSVSFLNHMSPTNFPDGEMLDDPLLLDCAEYICTRMLKPKCKVPIQELARDISDGIEYLRSYTTSCGDTVVVDGIYSMMQRDLLWNEEVTGGWDPGWRNGWTTEAIDEVVHDIEKLVLSELLGDVIEFMA